MKVFKSSTRLIGHQKVTWVLSSNTDVGNIDTLAHHYFFRSNGSRPNDPEPKKPCDEKVSHIIAL